MLLTLSRILTPLVPSGPRCGRGSRLAGGLRSVRRRRRRLLLIPRRLRCWVGAARRSSGHVFLRISPDANYHCHISAPESAIERNDRRCLGNVEERKKRGDLKKTGQCKVKSVDAISYGVRRRVQRDQYIQKKKKRRLNRHPIRIRKYREASSKVNCSQPFRNP